MPPPVAPPPVPPPVPPLHALTLHVAAPVQAEQTAPPLPQASTAVPGRHSWFASQQPFVHVVASQPAGAPHEGSHDIRSELTKRLQSGDAIVWLLLKSVDDGKTAAVRELLKQQCHELPNKVKLPEGIGLPGSELYSEVPLLLQFSVLEIDPGDPNEQFLVRQLTGFQADAATAGEPLIVPVFGRGRALEVIPAPQLDADLSHDLTEFLCGACSCQVKEQSPGFDLLLSTDWNDALFGDDSEGPPPEAASGNGQRKVPELVPIPSGKKRGSE